MRWTLLFCCASLAFAQGGTEPKPKAEDYEVHVQGKYVAIGAEYTIHSFSGQGQTFIAKDYLVVEVALYPPKGHSIAVHEGEFVLRINGNKKGIAPSPPGMVASSLQHSDWQTGPRLEGSVGAGPADVIFGRSRRTQVPGGEQPRVPTPPRVPDADPPGGIQPEPRARADEVVVQAALPEGNYRGPVSGFLYFPYKGKITSVRSLELLYDDAVLKLR